jgi:FixJ family two-component response regulator
VAASGGQPGNQNAKKSRAFEQALIRAIKQRDLKDGEGETLRKVAEALLDKAIAADLTAIKETRDTLDGKPAQSITGADGEPLVVRIEASDANL